MSLFSQSLSEKLARKEKEYQELEEHLGAERAAKKGAEGSLRERELEAQELQARATGAEGYLTKAQTELAERAEEVAKLKKEITELEVKHAELKVERKQLQQQREEKDNQGAQQQAEISQVSPLYKFLLLLLSSCAFLLNHHPSLCALPSCMPNCWRQSDSLARCKVALKNRGSFRGRN